MKNLKNIDDYSPRLRHSVKERLTGFVPGLFLLVLLVLWEISVSLSKIEAWILPAPSAIFQSLWKIRGLLWTHSLQTLYEAMMGLLLAIFLGIGIAILIDRSYWVKRALYPLLVISQTIPIIAIAPLFLIWFGYGLVPKVVVVTLVCFFPIAVNLVDGFSMVDKDMIRLITSMGASPMQVFRKVKLPSALPFFFSGLRISGTYSVMGAVIGEWLGASRGLGILMTRSSQSFMTDRVFATILIITFLSLMIFTSIELLARYSMPWYYSRKKVEINHPRRG